MNVVYMLLFCACNQYPCPVFGISVDSDERSQSSRAVMSLTQQICLFGLYLYGVPIKSLDALSQMLKIDFASTQYTVTTVSYLLLRPALGHSD